MASADRRSNRTQNMIESMASDAPDTADERSSRSSRHRRATPVDCATRTARGGTVPRPAAPARKSDQATQDMSEQSTSGSSDDEEASDTINYSEKVPPMVAKLVVDTGNTTDPAETGSEQIGCTDQADPATRKSRQDSCADHTKGSVRR